MEIDDLRGHQGFARSVPKNMQETDRFEKIFLLLFQTVVYDLSGSWSVVRQSRGSAKSMVYTPSPFSHELRYTRGFLLKNVPMANGP